MKHCKTDNSPLICKKRHSLPSAVIETEKWLSDMAAGGQMLRCIEAGKYFFEECSPIKCRFFLLNPEHGNNSESWIFYDLEKLCGKQIPCKGPFFFSPQLALQIPDCKEAVDNEMIEYYYQYRNWRLARRLLVDTILWSASVILSGLIVALQPGGAILLLIGSILLLGAASTTLGRFLNSAGGRSVLKKPHRPGY